MKSGDTNKIIHFLKKNNLYLWQKHCLTMRLYLEKNIQMGFLYHFTFILQIKTTNYSAGQAKNLTLISINTI